METRKEIDSLGEREVPEDAYFSIKTLRAVENFPVIGMKASQIFFKAMFLLSKLAVFGVFPHHPMRESERLQATSQPTTYNTILQRITEKRANAG